MFIRPNEFEAQLATVRCEAPAYKKSHRGAGLACLLFVGMLVAAGLAFLACWAVGALLVHGVIRLARLLRDTARYCGWHTPR